MANVKYAKEQRQVFRYAMLKACYPFLADVTYLWSLLFHKLKVMVTGQVPFFSCEGVVLSAGWHVGSRDSINSSSTLCPVHLITYNLLSHVSNVSSPSVSCWSLYDGTCVCTEAEIIMVKVLLKLFGIVNCNSCQHQRYIGS